MANGWSKTQMFLEQKPLRAQMDCHSLQKSKQRG